jgi:Mce-associated membrane protein
MLPKLPTSAEPAGPEPPDASAAEPVVGRHSAAAETAAAENAAAPTVVDPDRKARVRLLTVLGVAAVLLIAGAVLLAVQNYSTRANGPLANQAFVDTGGTAEVVGAMTAAVKAVYSYDFKTLDQNEAEAKGYITGPFAEEFDRVFAPVKQLAPKEQAVLTTDVPAVGVMQLDGDRARLLMMVDQRGTRAGGQPIAGTSARLIVQAQRVDGRWKIVEVTPE